MRGSDHRQDGMLSDVSLESRVLHTHPLRQARAMVDRALKSISPGFWRRYASEGRPSTAPEGLLRALLLQEF